MAQKPASLSMKVVAVGLWVVAVAGLGVAIAVQSQWGDAAAVVVFSSIVLAFACTGLVLAIRVSNNRIGWLYLCSGVLGGIYIASFTYTEAAVAQGWSGAAFTATLSDAAYFPWILTMVSLPILLFPEGKPPSSRWRWLVWVIGVFMVVWPVGTVLRTVPNAEFESLSSPFGVDVVQRVLDVPGVVLVVGILLIVSLIGPVVSLVARFRRSVGIERQQLKWLVYAASIAGLGLVATYTVGQISDSVWIDTITAVALLAVLAIPVATGFAVSRYRLYDIDRLVNRAIVYGIVVVLLSALYAAAVTGATALLPTQGNSLAIAATVVVTASVFSPLRRRVQVFIDRRFYRSRYSADLVAHDFTEQIRDQIDLDAIVQGWVSVVNETLHPETVGSWIKKAASPHNHH